MPIIIPPIKSQGIKTKLVPWINTIIRQSGLDLPHTNWIEPFFGTGVVGFNAPVGGRVSCWQMPKRTDMPTTGLSETASTRSTVPSTSSSFPGLASTA